MATFMDEPLLDPVVGSYSNHEGSVPTTESQAHSKEQHANTQHEVLPNGSPPAPEAVANSSKGKGKEVQNSVSQHRLSLAVPKRKESNAFLNEDQPWDAKNILSFGMTIPVLGHAEAYITYRRWWY